MSYNRCVFVGNVTRDPELRHIGSGMAVTDITIAVNERRKNKDGENTESTEFFDLTAWGKTAEIAAQYATKGKQVLVECRARTDKWEDKSTGEKRSKIKFTVDNLVLLSSNSGTSGSASRPSQATVSQTDNETEEEDDLDDSIPF